MTPQSFYANNVNSNWSEHKISQAKNSFDDLSKISLCDLDVLVSGAKYVSLEEVESKIIHTYVVAVMHIFTFYEKYNNEFHSNNGGFKCLLF